MDPDSDCVDAGSEASGNDETYSFTALGNAHGGCAQYYIRVLVEVRAA